MSGWMIVVVVAIVMSSMVKMFALRHKRDADTLMTHADTAENAALRHEVKELRERVRVLERIATDANTATALESRRVSDEIEALRDNRTS